VNKVEYIVFQASWTRLKTTMEVSPVASRGERGPRSRTNNSWRWRTSSSRPDICQSANDLTSPSHSTSPKHRYYTAFIHQECWLSKYTTIQERTPSHIHVYGC